MKQIVFILILAGMLCVSSLNGSQDSKASNLLPMFGGGQKTPLQMSLDEKFIEEVVKLTGSRQKGSEEFVKRGWESFFAKRDTATAMMRFNQAWLLNSENPEVFWGFGVVSGAMRKIDDSVKFLRQAAEMLPDNARILNDLGFSLTHYAGDSDNPDEVARIFGQALTCFARAEKLEPGYEPLYSNWAIALFLKRDFAGAWDKIIKAEKLGGKTINPMFIKDLEKQMARPKN